jgi:1,4-dihydroxy-2-naphthoate polyprenyltransferase
MARASDWLQAARPKTLGAALAPVLVGTALGWKLTGVWHPWLAVCALLSCMALQVATNWFNDALDALKGADTERRLGPRRITASGVVSPNAVIVAGVGMLVLAVVLALPLWWARGWPIVWIGIPSLYFCFGYTGGPLPLAYRGLGELFVIAFFGLVAVTGSAFVQTGAWHAEAMVAGLQVGCLSTVLIAINNLRDRDEDLTTGKRTLAVRLGERFARWEVVVLIVLPFLLNAYWLMVGLPWLSGLPLLALLPGIKIIHAMLNGTGGVRLNGLLAMAGGMLVLFSLLFACACGL